MVEFWKSRRFWVLSLDFVGIVGGFVVRSYFPQYQDAIILIVGAAQPLVMYLLSVFTVEDSVKQAVMRVRELQMRESRG